MSTDDYLIPGENIEEYESKWEQYMHGTIIDIGMYDNRPETIVNTGELNKQIEAQIAKLREPLNAEKFEELFGPLWEQDNKK